MEETFRPEKNLYFRMNFLDTCIRHTCTHCQLNVYYTEIKFQCVNKPAIHERIYIKVAMYHCDDNVNSFEC